jgi:hypothetical protein
VSALLFCIVATWVATGCGKKDSNAPKLDADVEADKAAMASLALKHSAIVEWRQTLKKRSFSPPFTLELQKALSPTNGALTLFLVELQDVEERENGFRATFSQTYFSDHIFNVVLVMDCDSTHASKFIRDERDKFIRSYAVVARVSEVSRPLFAVEGTGTAENSRVEVDASHRSFLIRGSCIEAVRLKGIHLDQ